MNCNPLYGQDMLIDGKEDSFFFASEGNTSNNDIFGSIMPQLVDCDVGKE